MRAWPAAILAGLLALSLCGCAGDDRARAEAFLAQVRGAETIALEAALTARSGEKILEYTLACGYTDHTTRVEVLAPETLAGITAAVTADGTLTLSYEDLALEALPLAGTEDPPAGVLPRMLETLRSGHLDRLGRGDWEGEACLTLELLGEDGAAVALWLGEADGVPRYGELWTQGSRQAWWTITAWTLEGQTGETQT